MKTRQSGKDETEASGEKNTQSEPQPEAEAAGFPPDEKIQEGVRLFRMKNWDEALKEFLSKDTSDFSGEEKMEHSYYLGLCYAKLKRYDEALAYIEQIVISGGDILRVFQCRMTLAYIYVITGRVRMAQYELKKLQSNGLESPLLYNTLAYAAYIQKQNKDAIELYEKTLEIDSNNTTAMNSMGYILADTGTDVMRALRLCRKAVDSKPQSAAYLDSLGWAYYKSGEVVEARTWLRRAMDLAPDEEEIQRHFKIVTGEPL
jgi:tetratricopeptide (TPR) repeat protein